MARLLIGFGCVLTLMTITWAVSVGRHNAGLVDRVWGVAFVVLGAVDLATGAVTRRSWLGMAIVAVWGLRLSAHITVRGWGRGEEWRFQELRRRHGRAFAVRSLLDPFGLQAVAAVAVSTPLLAITRPGQTATWWLDGLGATVAVAGLVVEAAADAQLGRFRSSGSDGVLASGLWRYTRHPNYLGDATLWWGLGLLGVAAGHWWALVGPAGMLVVLLRVTGVPVMDRHMRATRGREYDDYVRRTSAFFPWPPRDLSAPLATEGAVTPG
ncbi:MAG: DUF1295 domain-containing protein [Actinobacteria bacterium]|nr:DUF1295 domain-containing protein [Actinomycetota bacterium]